MCDIKRNPRAGRRGRGGERSGLGSPSGEQKPIRLAGNLIFDLTYLIVGSGRSQKVTHFLLNRRINKK